MVRRVALHHTVGHDHREPHRHRRQLARRIGQRRTRTGRDRRAAGGHHAVAAQREPITALPRRRGGSRSAGRGPRTPRGGPGGRRDRAVLARVQQLASGRDEERHRLVVTRLVDVGGHGNHDDDDVARRPSRARRSRALHGDHARVRPPACSRRSASATTATASMPTASVTDTATPGRTRRLPHALRRPLPDAETPTAVVTDGATVTAEVIARSDPRTEPPARLRDGSRTERELAPSSPAGHAASAG